MNTTPIEISTSAVPLAQVGMIRPEGRAAAFPAGGNQAFQNRYQQEISRLETAREQGADIPLPVKTQARDQQVSAAVTQASGEMDETTGLAFLSRLEQLLLQLSGGDLKTLFTDAGGLDTLKKLLLKAGFDPEEVDNLMADLKEKAATGALDMGEVFDSLSELVVAVDEKATPEAVYLDTSALPFVKTILKELGLTDDQISDIVDAAEQGNAGISLDVVIEKLKAIDTGYRDAGQTLAAQDREGGFTRLLSQLNLPVTPDEGDTVTLGDLIRVFEDHRDQEKAAAATAREKSAAVASALEKMSSEPAAVLLNKLFQSISRTPEVQGLNFSYQQIKDQFLNEMMLPTQGDATRKGLFAKEITGPESRTETLLKGMVALLSKETTGDGAASSGREQTSRFTGKELKTDRSRTEVLFQAGSTSASDVDAPGTASRAKAAPRTLPAYVTQQVGRGVVRAVNQGEKSLTLQLKPPELGRLTMTIDHQSTGIKVSIVTENQSARDMLASNVNELKAALNSAGISLDSFDVDMNSDFRQSMANAGHQAGNRKNSGRQGGGSSGQTGEAADEIAAADGPLVTDGSYHFVA